MITINLWLILYVLAFPAGAALILVGIMGAAGIGVNDGRAGFWAVAIAGVSLILWGGTEIVLHLIAGLS